MVVVLDNANFFFFFLIVKKILLTKKLLHTTRMKQLKKYVQKKKKQHKGNHANVIMLIKFNELSKFSWVMIIKSASAMTGGVGILV